MSQTEKLTYANAGHVSDNEYEIYEYANGDHIADYRGYWKPKKGCWLLYPKKIRNSAKKHLVVKKDIDERQVLISIKKRY